MKYLTLLFLIFANCAPKTTYVTQRQVEQDTASAAQEPMPVLHAYRKAPGQAKTVQVQGYYRTDSTYVQPHTRTARTTKPTQ